MNIGVVVDNEFDNDTRVKNECKILAEEHNIFILCFDFGHPHPAHFPYKVERIRIKRKLKDLLFFFMNFLDMYSVFWKRHIRTFIRSNNIDYLYVHDLYMSKAAHLATKKTGIPFVLDLHENYPAAVNGYRWMTKFPNRLFTRPSRWEKREKRFLRYPARLVVLSEEFRDDLIAKYDFLHKEMFSIYPNIPNVREMLSYKTDPDILEKKQNDFFLFYFGGISRRRGILLLLEAMERIIPQHPDIKLLLVGPIDKNEKKTFLEKIHGEIKENVIYFPWKDISSLPSLVKISDVCISPIEKNPQHESGIANKVFQYMLLGCPLLVSDCRPQARLVSGSGSGLVFRWNDTDDLVRQILKLYHDPSLRKKMGEKGEKTILQNYTEDHFKGELLGIFAGSR